MRLGQRYQDAARRWVWWVFFMLAKRKGDGVVRAYREAQKATARLIR